VQKNGVKAVLRVISGRIPSPDDLALPQAVTDLSNLPRGLVLVTGPTGSGKSTTLACLVNPDQSEAPEPHLAIEDPIEFVYENKNSVVRQREIGSQSRSFAAALNMP